MKNEDLTRLAALVGIEPEKFKALLPDENQEAMTIPTLFTEAEKDQFGSNKFKEGRKAEKEILAKEMAKELGVDVDEKDPIKVANAYAELKITEAKVPVDDQLKALKADKEKLQTLVQNKETALTETENKYKSQIFRFELKQKVLSNLPADTLIPKEDLTELFMLRNEIGKDDEGKIIIKKEGKILKDNLENPLSLESVVKSFSEGYIKKAGIGIGDRVDGGTPEKFEKMSQFAKWAKENGMSATEDKALQILSKRKAEGFVYDEIPDESL